MRRIRLRWCVPILLVTAVGLGCTPQPCTPTAGEEQPFNTLDAWCMVTLRDGKILPAPGVLPYDLNTPLFSDGAIKRRTVWLPPGTTASYDDQALFDFPDGTVFTKSFGFPDDLRKAQPTIHWVETRVEWRVAGAWHAIRYTWDDAQTAATVSFGGEVRAISWIDATGATRTAEYELPDAQQCKQCHQDVTGLVPIGPKARNLNRSYPYAGGAENQLLRWTEAGLLTGSPAPDLAPRLAVWNDPTTGSIEKRARAYLESNCAHCHHVGGTAQAYGLVFLVAENDPYRYGVCKQPLVSGPGSGGYRYVVAPGTPDQSVLRFRMASTDPDSRMPQIGRSIVDEEGLALVISWIAGLPGSCP
jgi:uncharacterized repeat protein (TIGR03806 family)